jgi:hypothetical protein
MQKAGEISIGSSPETCMVELLSEIVVVKTSAVRLSLCKMPMPHLTNPILSLFNSSNTIATAPDKIFTFLHHHRFASHSSNAASICASLAWASAFCRSRKRI